MSSLQCINKTEMNQDAHGFAKIPFIAGAEYTFERMQIYLKLTSVFVSELLRVNFEKKLGGTTFVACLKAGAFYLTTHAGDSKVCVARPTDHGWEVEALTIDHDQAHDHRKELKWHSSAPDRLSAYPHLNMTRSFGDWSSEAAGLSHIADVGGGLLTKKSVFIVGSDGLFDMLSLEDIREFLNTHIPVHSLTYAISSVSSADMPNWQALADQLTRVAQAKWLRRHEFSDDITIMIHDTANDPAETSPSYEADLLMIGDGHCDEGELFAQYAVALFPKILKMLLEFNCAAITDLNREDFGHQLYQYLRAMPAESMNYVDNSLFEINLKRFVLPYLELLTRQDWLSGTEAELDTLIARYQEVAKTKNPELESVDISVVKSILLKSFVHNFYQNAIQIKAELDELGIYEGFNLQFFAAIHWYTKFIINMGNETSFSFDQIRMICMWTMFHKCSFDHISVNLHEISEHLLASVNAQFGTSFPKDAVANILAPLYQRAILYQNLLDLQNNKHAISLNKEIFTDLESLLARAYPVSVEVLFEPCHAPHLFNINILMQLFYFLFSNTVDNILSLPTTNFMDALHHRLATMVTGYKAMAPLEAAALRNDIVQYRAWLLVNNFFASWSSVEEDALSLSDARHIKDICRKLQAFDAAKVNRLIREAEGIFSKNISVVKKSYDQFEAEVISQLIVTGDRPVQVTPWLDGAAPAGAVSMSAVSAGAGKL